MSPQDEARIIAYLDENLPAGELPALEQLLRESPEARRKLRIHATISEELAPAISDAEIPTSSARPAQRTSLIPWAIAALTSAVALFLWWNGQFTEPESGEPSDVIALLVSDAGADFATNAAPRDVSFHQGDYQLTDGAIHLRFTNGTDLVMEAPAQFTIDDAFHIHLASGDVRAIVPPSGQGFTIAAGDIAYEDLGTEFGVSAHADGSSELHVFAGQVDAHPSDQDTVSVLGGDSLRFDPAGQLEEADNPTPDRFITPDTIGIRRWQQHQAQMAESRGLIAWFDFEDLTTETIPNLAPNSSIRAATLSGARSVSGRWSGKSGLLFDRDSDYVAIDLPDAYDELTLAVWIKPTSFDFAINALFNSDGWKHEEKGSLHWQINRHGQIAIAHRESHVFGYTGSLDKAITTGRWQHLVATLSTTTGQHTIYLDGRPIASGRLIKNSPIIPRSCRLGNWLPEPGTLEPVRALRARIDEFAIWNRALSQDEIKNLSDAGRPLSPLEAP